MAQSKHLAGIGGWNNRSIRTKLTIILIGLGTIPVLVSIQAITTISRNRTFADLQTNLNKDGASFVREYVEWSRTESERTASTRAQLITASGLDINNPASKPALQTLTKIDNGADPESNANFVIILNQRGQVVAREVLELQPESINLPVPDQPIPPPKYRPVNALPLGTSLKDLSIVASALNSRKAKSGIELLPANLMQKLGLANQSTLELRPQPVENLPENLRPLPSGTFNIDNGRIGLVSMAVEPIEKNNQVVGLVVVGNVLNRNYGIVDSFARNFKVSVATIFAQDLRVATNVPYTDKTTRAIGTRASREVAEQVLRKKETFSGITNIVGQNYVTVYVPLYDHTGQQPVGMAFVGTSLTEIEQRLLQEQLLGFVVGAGVLFIAVVIAVPITGNFITPLERLAEFTRRLGSGELTARLPETQRGDEIGILERDLNFMAQQLEALVNDQQIKAIALEQTQAEIEAIAQKQRQEKEQLQRRALELLMQVDPVSRGDLTVRATVTSDEVGTLADSYNSIIRSLRQIVGDVQSAAQSVSVTAIDSTEAVQAVVEDTNRQTQSLASALEQISDMVASIQAVAQRAQQAEAKVQMTKQVVLVGDNSADRALEGINALKNTVVDTATKVERLGNSSEKITKAVKVIRNFAAQTNLLALNASIEAARAGEEGESFAVVAEKVRALAQQSASASNEIESIVDDIQTQIQEVMTAMTAGAQQAETGTKLVRQVRQILQEITSASNEADQLVQEIASSATAQTTTSQAVSQTMRAVADTSQSTAQRSQAVVNAFERLLALAENLQASIAQFKLETT
jgi:methyl-accepting chemotaxis protein